MKDLQPTESYQISLPDDVVQEFDEDVSSFWRPHSGTALQLSSRVRTSGPQVNADWCPNIAAATYTKSNGWVWTHAYLVWQDLVVYATIMRPPDEDPNSDAWALEAVKSIRKTVGHPYGLVG